MNIVLSALRPMQKSSGPQTTMVQWREKGVLEILASYNTTRAAGAKMKLNVV